MMERESYHPPPYTPQPSESPETGLGRFPAAVAQWGWGWCQQGETCLLVPSICDQDSYREWTQGPT